MAPTTAAVLWGFRIAAAVCVCITGNSAASASGALQHQLADDRGLYHTAHTGDSLPPAPARAALIEESTTGAAASTPPMGWRNWNFFQGNITQTIMENQMSAMANTKRPVWNITGKRPIASLMDVGYGRAGLDDNWQLCHGGVAGPGSKVGSFHDKNGVPLINTSRFPDMKGMVSFAHTLGLKIGFYDNNCICGEGSSRLTPDMVRRDVAGDVAYIASVGFDGLKVGAKHTSRIINEIWPPLMYDRP